MRRWSSVQLTLLIILTFALAGCGLLGGDQRERQNENAAVTKGVSLGQVVMAEGIGEENAPFEIFLFRLPSI